MNLDQIIPAIALIAVLILVLPSFIETNLEKKHFLKILVFGLLLFYFLWYFCIYSSNEKNKLSYHWMYG